MFSRWLNGSDNKEPEGKMKRRKARRRSRLDKIIDGQGKGTDNLYQEENTNSRRHIDIRHS